LKSIFRINGGNREESDDDEYVVDEARLIDTMLTIREGSLYQLLMKIGLYSGARLSEIVKMIREWDEARLICFEGFCRYKMKWHRGRKRCDYIYLPSRFLDEIRRYAGKIGKYGNLRKHIYDEYGIRMKEFRKLNYRICLNAGIEEAICDFYQSRITKLSVGRKYYDALRSRADEKYQLLVKAIDNFVNEMIEKLYIGKPLWDEAVVVNVDEVQAEMEKREARKIIEWSMEL